MKAILIEPLLVLATCLFWLLVLPLSGLFCASVAIYDKVASLGASKIRLPDLRHSAAVNPLVLRRTAPSGGKEPTPSRRGTQAVQV